MGHRPRRASALVVLLAASVLAGCLGGGSYGDLRTLQHDEAPVAHGVARCHGLACTLDGSGSTDADGRVVAWTWGFPNGSSASGARVQHTFASFGRQVVTLEVEDDGGRTDATFLVIHVPRPGPDAANPPPDYHARGNGTVGSSLDRDVTFRVLVGAVANLRIAVNLSAAPLPLVPASVNVTLVDPGAHVVRGANLTALQPSMTWDLQGSEASRVGTWTLHLRGGNPAAAGSDTRYAWAVTVDYPPPGSS